MKHAWFKTTLALAIMAASSHSLASGFALNEQSVSGLGTSFAGRSSAADDATTVFGNPAGMARLKREQISGGFALLNAKADIDDASGSFAGSNDGDMVPFTGTPMGYYVKPLDDRWTFGFGLYIPFGLITDYESNFQGRYYGDRSEVRVITLQPTLSFQVNEQLSVGFGPTINRIDGELSSALPNLPGFGDGEVKIKGDDLAVGFNAGVLYQITPQTRLGLTYHSMVDYNLTGDTTVSGPGPIIGASAGQYDASLKVKTPESVDLSVTYDLDERWTLYAGSTWTRWSRLEALTVESQGIPAPLGPLLSTISEEQQWHDTWSYAVGAAYKLSPRWTLRAGLALDQTPVHNEFRSPRIPTADRTIGSIGLAWNPNQDITFDLAYSYLQEEDAKIAQTSAIKGSYNATYRNSAHGLGTQLTYRF